MRLGADDKMGSTGNNETTVPSGLPAPKRTLYVSEVFYKFKPKPRGTIWNRLPSVLY